MFQVILVGRRRGDDDEGKQSRRSASSQGVVDEKVWVGCVGRYVCGRVLFGSRKGVEREEASWIQSMQWRREVDEWRRRGGEMEKREREGEGVVRGQQWAMKVRRTSCVCLVVCVSCVCVLGVWYGSSGVSSGWRWAGLGWAGWAGGVCVYQVPLACWAGLALVGGVQLAAPAGMTGGRARGARRGKWLDGHDSRERKATGRPSQSQAQTMTQPTQRQPWRGKGARQSRAGRRVRDRGEESNRNPGTPNTGPLPGKVSTAQQARGGLTEKKKSVK